MKLDRICRAAFAGVFSFGLSLTAMGQVLIGPSNPGFETDVLADGLDIHPAGNWDEGYYIQGQTTWNFATNIAGAINPDAAYGFGGTAPAGDNIGWVLTSPGNDTGMRQILGVSLQADSVYDLTLQVGNPSAFNTGITTGDYRVELVANNVVLASTTAALPAPDSWVPVALNYDYNASPQPGALGSPVEIRLLNVGNGNFDWHVNFDEVALTLTTTNPVADAGGPYAVPTLGSLSLDGSASLPASGEASITTYEWDIDNDGQYDDATGATPAAISEGDLIGIYGMSAGDNTIGLRVTDTGANVATTTTIVNLDPVPTPTAYWPMREGTPGDPAAAVDDVIDDPSHPAGDATANNANASWVADPDRGIVWSTVEGNRLTAGQQGIDLNDGFSWVFWVKVNSSNSTDSGADVIIGTRQGGGTASSTTAWHKMDAGGQVSAWNGNFTYGNVMDDTWHHVAYVGDLSGRKLYIDGVEAGSDDTVDVNTIDRVLEIGGSSQYTEDVTGLYSELAVYKSRLSEDHIAILYAGATALPDTTAPVIAVTTPVDDDPSAPFDVLQAIFDEPVVIGSGDIRIVNLTDATTTTIAVTDAAQVTVGGASITIHPTTPLVGGKSYAIEMDAGVVTSLSSGLPFAGILDQTTWNFSSDNVPPTLVSMEDNFSGGPIYETITEVTYTVTFNEPIDGTSVDVADFDNAGTATAGIGSVTQTSDTTFSVVMNPSTTGTLILRIPVGATIDDVAGNAFVPPDQDDTEITINAGSYPPVTMTSNAGSSNDNWNIGTNWDGGFVPFNAIPAIIDAGIAASARNADTPEHSAGLTFSAGSSLRIYNISGSANALGTGTVTMLGNTELRDERGVNASYPAIVVSGSSNKIYSTDNDSHGDSRDFDGVISGGGQLIVHGDNRHYWRFNQTNTFSGGLVSDSDDRMVIEFNAPGAAGAGDVTINGRTNNADLRGAILKLGSDDVFADSATLTLNSTGNNNSGWPSGAYNGILLEMQAFNDTIASLVVAETPQPAGTYGSVGTAATVDFEVTWIRGDGVLTVTGGGGGTPYDGWAGGPFAGTLTDPDPELDFDGGSVETGLEWVLAGDPTDAGDDASLVPTTDNSDPDFFSFTFRRADAANADGNTTIAVEYGNDLSGWTTAVHDGTDIIITANDDAVATGVDEVVVQLRRSAFESVVGELFVRLNVTVATP